VFIRVSGGGAPIRPRVVQGRPAGELLRAARSAQLLVLGGPARGRVAGLLLGSVSQHCVQHATCPVLIVPTEPALATARPDQRAGGVMSPGRSATP
jgi:nucleotide-binding universal stress UspA family protein